MSVSADRSLFAAKGQASAAGVRLPADIADVPAAEPAATPDEAAARSLLAETTGIAEKKATADQQPGSLLAFCLRSAPGKSALTSDIVTALSRPEAEIVTGTAAEQPAPPASEATAAQIPATSRLAPIPVGSGSASGRIDPPAFPRSMPQRRDMADDRGAARLDVPSPPTYVAAPRASTLRTVLPAAAAVVAIAVVGWLIAQSDPTPPEAATVAASESPAVESAAPAVLALPEAAQPAANPSEPSQTATADAPAAIETPAPLETASAEAAPEPAPPAVLPSAGAPSQSMSSQSMPPQSTASAIPADAPSFEVVRAGPGAPPVLAGRAAPGSQLLVLDNGAPIGAATADANGEWAMVGEAPLSPGRHELSLALKTPEGSLVVEQADADMAPGAGASAGLPIPAEKPTPGVVERNYVVQLASVPSPADATREWARLQQAYPALLGQREVIIDAAEIGDRGTFYRIRTGPFSERDDARSLCRELNGAGQECLVVRGASGS